VPGIDDRIMRRHVKSIRVAHDTRIITHASVNESIVVGDGQSPTSVETHRFRRNVDAFPVGGAMAMDSEEYPVPDMRMTAETTVRLISSATVSRLPAPPADIVWSGPVVTRRPAGPLSTMDLMAMVDTNMDCVLRYTTMDQMNSGQRSRCFDNLTSTLMRASGAQLEMVALRFLDSSQGSQSYTAAHVDLLVDALGHLPAAGAQALLARHVLRAATPDEELVKRTLIIVSRGLLESSAAPAPALISAIEALAFHADALPPRLRTKVVRQRAMLTLGVVVRALAAHDEEEAHRLVERLEDELGQHRDEESLQLRARREARRLLLLPSPPKTTPPLLLCPTTLSDRDCRLTPHVLPVL